MNGPRAASAFSSHPEPAVAAGECVGSLLDSGVRSPDLLVVAVAAPIAQRLGDLGELLDNLISPRTMIGVAAEAVLGGSDLAHPCTIGVLAWTSLGPAPALQPIHVPAERLEELADLRAAAAVLFADPFSVPEDRLLAVGGAPYAEGVSGGYVAVSTRRGGNRFLVEGRVVSDGVVGVAVHAPHAVTFGTSGGALLGSPVTVTGASGRVLHSLDTTNALNSYRAVLNDVGAELDPHDAVRHGVLHLAVVQPGGSAEPTVNPSPPVYRDAVGGSRAGVRTVRIVELVPDDDGGGSLVTEEPLPAGTRAYFEVFSSWSSAADLGRQYHEQGRMRRAGDAGLLIADQHGAAMACGRDLGDLLGDMPTLGVVCSEVLERRSGAPARLATGRADLVHLGSP